MGKGIRISAICLFFLICIFTAFGFGYSLRGEKEEVRELGEATTVQAIPNLAPYQVLLENNNLVLYENGQEVKTLPIDWRSVSPQVREELSKGVNAETIEEIYHLLEDITS